MLPSNELRLEQVMSGNRRFEFPTQFCLAGDAGEAFICFQNFYDQIFRDADVPVDLHLFGFSPEGEQVGARILPLASGEAIQFSAAELGMKQPGLVVAAALPRFDLDRLAEGRLRLKQRIGTGFYIIWRDARGHVDTMHEWLSVSPEPIGRRSFYVVFEHGDGAIARHGLVLMSPVVERNAVATARLSVYTRTGHTLASSSLPALQGMASRLVYLDEVFSDFQQLLAQELVLGVRADTRNMVEPFSLELHRSGDFHLHHIN